MKKINITLLFAALIVVLLGLSMPAKAGVLVPMVTLPAYTSQQSEEVVTGLLLNVEVWYQGQLIQAYKQSSALDPGWYPVGIEPNSEKCPTMKIRPEPWSDEIILKMAIYEGNPSEKIFIYNSQTKQWEINPNSGAKEIPKVGNEFEYSFQLDGKIGAGVQTEKFAAVIKDGKRNEKTVLLVFHFVSRTDKIQQVNTFQFKTELWQNPTPSADYLCDLMERAGDPGCAMRFKKMVASDNKEIVDKAARSGISDLSKKYQDILTQISQIKPGADNSDQIAILLQKLQELAGEINAMKSQPIVSETKIAPDPRIECLQKQVSEAIAGLQIQINNLGAKTDNSLATIIGDLNMFKTDANDKLNKLGTTISKNADALDKANLGIQATDCKVNALLKDNAQNKADIHDLKIWADKFNSNQNENCHKDTPPPAPVLVGVDINVSGCDSWYYQLQDNTGIRPFKGPYSSANLPVHVDAYNEGSFNIRVLNASSQQWGEWMPICINPSMAMQNYIFPQGGAR